MYKLKLTNLQKDILRLLFVYAGTTLNQRRISQILFVSQTAVMKALPGLEKEKLILIEQDKKSKRWAIQLNRDNQRIIQFKRADNLKQIYESGLAEYLEKEFAGATIILFGSYSKGEDTKRSDIDIAVIGRKEKKADLKKFSETLERPININFYDVFNKIHKHLKENLCNGIVLVGGIEL